MSHLTKMTEVYVTDLTAAQAVCDRHGLELLLNQPEKMRWYGVTSWLKNEADGTVAQNVKHVIRIKGDVNAYTIGLVPRTDGPGFTMVFDDFDRRLAHKLGEGLINFRRDLSAETALRQVRKLGFSVTKTVTTDGKIQLRARR